MTVEEFLSHIIYPHLGRSAVRVLGSLFNDQISERSLRRTLTTGRRSIKLRKFIQADVTETLVRRDIEPIVLNFDDIGDPSWVELCQRLFMGNEHLQFIVQGLNDIKPDDDHIALQMLARWDVAVFRHNIGMHCDVGVGILGDFMREGDPVSIFMDLLEQEIRDGRNTDHSCANIIQDGEGSETALGDSWSALHRLRKGEGLHGNRFFADIVKLINSLPEAHLRRVYLARLMYAHNMALARAGGLNVPDAPSSDIYTEIYRLKLQLADNEYLAAYEGRAIQPATLL